MSVGLKFSIYANKHAVPQNHGFIVANPIKMDDFGYPNLWKTTISAYLCWKLDMFVEYVWKLPSLVFHLGFCWNTYICMFLFGRGTFFEPRDCYVGFMGVTHNDNG